MAINGQKLKAKFQELREARRKSRERAATHRAATKEVFLKEKESQELKFAKARAGFQAQEQFKQYKTQAARPSLAKRAGDFLQPAGQATGFEPRPQQKQGVDMGFFDSNFFGAPQRQAPKQKRKRKAKKKGKKKRRSITINI